MGQFQDIGDILVATMLATALLALTVVCQNGQSSTTPRKIDDTQGASISAGVKTVALLPWSMAAGTEGARETAKKTLDAIFLKTNYQVLPIVNTKKVWEEDMQQPAIDMAPELETDLKPLPSPKELLALGQRLHVDLVCAGRAVWRTKSVWVSLGPKTKSDCTVDVLLIDVAKKEIVLDAQKVKADDTKVESSLETAGALLIGLGITALSGGPKDPHERKAGANAIATAFEPWMKASLQRSNKIGR